MLLSSDLIIQVRQDRQQVSDLIEQYTPWIIKEIQSITGQYVTVAKPGYTYKNGQDHYLTIAMEAFSEAVMQYDGTKGTFLNFASLVIRRRIIDSMRKESKYDASRVSMEALREEVASPEEDALLKLEIVDYINRLADFGITIEGLIKSRPTTATTIKQLKDVAEQIAENSQWMQQLSKNKKLNCTKIATELGIHRKWIAKYFDFIVSMVIIRTEHFEQLYEWVEGGE